MCSPPRAVHGPAALLLLAGALQAQSLTVSPKSLTLVQPEGGPAAAAALTIDSSSPAPQPWTATAAPAQPDDPWIELRNTSGVTPGRLTVAITDWRGATRKPGKYSAKITVRAGDAVQTIPVEWEVRPALARAPITSPAGPSGCSPSEGYPDMPLCAPLPLAGVLGVPAPGTSYTDPNFGARVRVLTPPKYAHPYSTPSPLSAHNKYLIAINGDGAYDVLEVSSGKTLVRRTHCNQGCFWDAADDELYYSIESASILRHEVRGNKTSVLIDYAKEPDPLHEIWRGGTGDTSRDNWISFWAPDEKKICALDINNRKTYCADYAASQRRVPYGDIDFTLITKGADRQTGKRYVLLIAGPAMGVFSVDTTAGVLKPEFRGPENLERNGNKDGRCDPGERCLVGSHLDTLEDTQGIQYLVENQETTAPCEVALNTLQISKGPSMMLPVEAGGGRRRVMTMWRCGPGWVDEHIACAKAAPYCVISTQSEMRRPGDLSQVRPTPHAGELILLRGAGEEVRRIAMTRTTLFINAGDKYWEAPRAAIASDASLIVSDTNFGEPGNPRILLVETGIQK